MDIAKIRKRLKKLEKNGHQLETDNKDSEKLEVNTSTQANEKPEPLTTEEHPLPEYVETIDKEEVAKEEKKSENEETVKEKVVAEKIESYSTEKLIEILSFKLLQEDFAFKISQLEEILKPQRITKVPKTPKYIMGITSLRGKVIPVIDLKLKLSLTDDPSPIDHKGKILILKGPKGKIGVAVDSLTGVTRLEKSEIQPPPSHLTEAELRFIEGVAIVNKRFVSIINTKEVTDIKLHNV